VNPELSCATARVEISARLDGESNAQTARALDEHLRTCGACRHHEAQLLKAHRFLRLQPVDEVPDLTGAIIDRIRGEAERPDQRQWTVRLRVASVAAAAAALLVAGASLPFVEQLPDTAGAGEIVRRVRTAARTLTTYRATFEITERNWHPRVPLRHFSAEVSYEAPERLRLTVRDLTVYPGSGWPRNNVDLVAGASRWWIREPVTCPPQALPGCAAGSGTEERTVVHRRPFDGTTRLPTDIVVPLETIASSGDFDVLGETEVAGRASYKVVLPYRYALPLVMALEAGGSWRGFDPLDRVEVWIDKDTWFPLRFEVYAGDEEEAALTVAASTFSEPPSVDDDVFAAPRTGIVRSGGFMPRRFGTVAASLAPSITAGLDPYRAGTTPQGRVLSYARGMTWLKVEELSRPTAPPLTAEAIRLTSGWAYYQPADESFKRRIDMFTAGSQLHLESNLQRSELVRVAESLGVVGERVPAGTTAPGLDIERVGLKRASALGYLVTPSYLPKGYRFSSALVARSRRGSTTTLYYLAPEAEYEGFGIRVTQSPSLDVLPPSSEVFTEVAIGNVRGRWSSERGELEWIEDGTYRAVAVPSFDLATAVRIARSM
jgi:hypothetical protein